MTRHHRLRRSGARYLCHSFVCRVIVVLVNRLCGSVMCEHFTSLALERQGSRVPLSFAGYHFAMLAPVIATCRNVGARGIALIVLIVCTYIALC